MVGRPQFLNSYNKEDGSKLRRVNILLVEVTEIVHANMH
jgi:hypothetical protein